MKESKMSEWLSDYLKNIEAEFKDIPSDRTNTLKTIGDYISTSIKETGSADLVFICTHNSRRSQLGQAWAETASKHYGISKVSSYSGGMEATAFNARAVEALKRAGFAVENSGDKENNPTYLVTDGSGSEALSMFSKKFDDPSIPGNTFCAIVVCSDADKACPIVPGAAERISMPYDDPKEFDGTELETSKYDERCREIAREMFFLFDYINSIQ